MRPIVVLGLGVMAFGLSACAADASDQPLDRAAAEIPSTGDPVLAELAADAVAHHGVPAVAVARVDPDGDISIGVAGTRGRGDETPVQQDSRFHLGSETKAMTAVLVAQLVESGDLDLDAPVTEVLPDADVDPSLAPLTIREVLGHRSGLTDDFDLRALHAATDPVATRREVVLAALGQPAAKPGQYAYANVNYMLAGVVIEEITDTPWSDVMAERIFEPLGMATCGFGAPGGSLDPFGHTADGTAVRHDAALTDNPAALDPAGRVHCSIGDWATFVGAVLRALAGTDSEVLSAAAAEDLFAGSEPYVAGWVPSEEGGERIYGHDGSNTLWYARAIMWPERRDAVLIAVNTGEALGVRAVDELTALMLGT